MMPTAATIAQTMMAAVLSSMRGPFVEVFPVLASQLVMLAVKGRGRMSACRVPSYRRLSTPELKPHQSRRTMRIYTERSLCNLWLRATPGLGDLAPYFSALYLRDATVRCRLIGATLTAGSCREVPVTRGKQKRGGAHHDDAHPL